MRLWRDSDVETEVRWFRCAEGAEELPYYTHFGSRNWEYAPPESPLGEVRRGGVWDNGSNPLHYSGTHFCGAEEDWEDGGEIDSDRKIVTNDSGMSACCLGLPGWVQTAHGGLALGGSAVQGGGGMVQPAIGGLVVGGVAAQHGGMVQPVVGGLVVGGVAAQHGGMVQPAIGGLVVGGVAAQHGGMVQPVVGGLVVGGVAAQSGGYNPTFIQFGNISANLIAGNYTVTSLTNALAGDLIVWMEEEQWGGAGPARIPSGYTRLLDFTQATFRYVTVAYRVATGTEAISYSWAAPGGTAVTGSWFLVRAARPAAPVVSGAAAAAGTSTIVAPSLTVPLAGALLLLGYWNNSSQSTGTPAGFTLAAALTPGANFHRSFRKAGVAAGATGSITVSCSTSATKGGVQVCVQS